jgi:uncharacterized protein (DUF1501 family)
MPFTRRDFMTRGTLMLSMGATAPTFLTKTASVLAETQDATMTGPNMRRILVVVQLGGGNDGLNSVVPYGDDRYYKARPTLAIAKSAVLPLNDRLGLNPNLDPFKGLYDAGHLAIVQGVGYPNPDRSHFRSTDIWTSARPDIQERTGWLGRFLDAQCSGTDRPLDAIDIGDTVSRLFWTGQSIVPALTSIDSFRFDTDGKYGGDSANQLATMRAVNAGGRAGGRYEDFLRRAANEALDTSVKLKTVAASYTSTATYPATGFAGGLQTIAKLIAADLGTRLFHITIGGFDTHAGQAGTHNTLLKTVSEGIQAFMRDLEGLGRADDVAVMTFSEFGRRVAENASGGTDHGAASSLYLIGGGMQAGIYGDNPNFNDLESGDLKYGIDFRSVYGTLIRDWLGVDPAGIIGGGAFPSIGFVAAPQAVSASPCGVASAQYRLAVTIDGGGQVSPRTSAFPQGAVASLVPTPGEGQVFTGWQVDGKHGGWANPLTIAMIGDSDVLASFAARPAFTDVPPDAGAWESIGQLAARGVIRGYGNGLFGPTDLVLRAQMAALIARAMGWDGEDHDTPFSDRGDVDDALWRNVGTLAYYRVARGYGDGSYAPLADVLNIQVVAFIARAMVARGYWRRQDNDAVLHPNIPASSGHREDITTYIHYAGEIRGAGAPSGEWIGWDQPATRGWFAFVQWQALDSYWRVDQVA